MEEEILILFNDEIPSDYIIEKELNIKVTSFSENSFEEGLYLLKEKAKEVGANIVLNTCPNTSNGFSFEGEALFIISKKEIEERKRQESVLENLSKYKRKIEKKEVFSKTFIYVFLSWVIINSINYIFSIISQTTVFIISSVILSFFLLFYESKDDFFKKMMFFKKI